MEDNIESIKGRGRPAKYSSEYLINIVKLYIKTNGKVTKVKPTPVAEFGAKTLKIKGMYYQHFTRNPEVMEFIENWNADIDKIILGSKKKDDGIIHSTIDIDRFLQNNKNEKKTRELLAQFNDNMSRITSKYSELEKKFTKQVELNLTLENKLKEVLGKLDSIDKKNKEKIKAEKQKRIKVQKLNDTLRKKVYIYEGFIKEYHTDVIALQALELENNKKNIGDSAEIERYVFENKDKYASGEYDLYSIIESYNNLFTELNNLNTPLDEDECPFDVDFKEEVFDKSTVEKLLSKYDIEICDDDEEDDDVFIYDNVDISIQEDDDEW